MRTITQEELNTILKKHLDFLQGIAGGEQADLSGADLSGADLHGADLNHANLNHANLNHADLSYANLIYADLHGADLSGADLIYADLHGANLRGTNLNHADLHGANLYGADLRGADLYGANLIGANITKTYLDEKEQYRKGVILKKPMMGYKKLADGSICVLSIPKGAIVFCINGSKCRTNKAKVLEGGGVSRYDNEFTYEYDNEFTYEKGKSYEIEGFDLAYNEEYSTGIHFFKTRKEAEDYVNN